MTQDVIPLLSKASFRCPHCGAIAHQDWYSLRADRRDKERLPFIPDANFVAQVKGDDGLEPTQKAAIINFATRMRRGEVFLDDQGWESSNLVVANLWLSLCFSCDDVSVWVHDRVLFPSYRFDITPNPDLPPEIKADFIEAMKIVDTSPRGSAALLRLCIQKLCKHLGKTGDNVNKDIADLVRDGLDARIQKALDIVRVVGNNAVHPGQMDLTDDKDTASKLFRLINMIADSMITQPKHVDEFYDLLPEASKTQIKKRDAPKE